MHTKQKSTIDIAQAVEIITDGGVIAYPTESVIGLGCDPFNADAVVKILNLKRRPLNKGLILIAADWSQVDHLVQPIPPESFARILTGWPGPTTWVFPCTPEVPEWIHGGHNTVAIRITDHPVCTNLCIQSGLPLVSTSANIDGQIPATDERTCRLFFPEGIDGFVEGSCGERHQPTPILDAVTGECYRKG